MARSARRGCASAWPKAPTGRSGSRPRAADGDPIAIATALAEVARGEAPDLVLCGAQSADAAQAATGTALAGLLDLPRVAVVNRIELEGGNLTVQRELEGGTVEVLRLGLPALLSVQTGINEPRYANLRAIKQAYAKPLDEFAAALPAASSETVALAPPQRGAGAEMLEGDSDAVAARIVAIAKEAIAR